jgi:hypothetical protein
VNSIENEKIQEILGYYNSKKSHDEEPLEILERCEGGFKIKITNMKNESLDDNKKIKQLRWSKGFLLSKNYTGFTEKETVLLYEALVEILGMDNVVLFQNK